ncbi:hypothetical protein A4R43_03050 [Amycolatopsis albispora]|uniref:Anti-sigma regulatory factor n=1 Tax=Amycolatopsis albispora TaxID=1804986 RepID=A0A344LJL4_9PSEU|nr:hypothetical protein A4R43_03050 [Amycolatopsis albispora]
MDWHGPLDGDAFTHPALFYRDHTDYLAATVPFVRAGLDNGEPVAVAVPGPNLTALKDAVHDDGVLWLDMTEAGRNPGRIIPGVLRAFADQHPGRRARIIGEPIWAGRSDDEYPACAQHEALINAAFRGRDATILCPYDSSRLSETALADATATHPLLVEGDRWWTSPHYAPGQIVDTYNQPLPQPGEVATYPATWFTPHTLTDIRQWAVGHAARAGLSPDRQDDVAIVVSELATNCIDHGDTTGALAGWTTADSLVFQTSNHTPSGRLDPLAGRLPAPDHQRRGRGLLMVNELADLVRTHTDGTQVTFRVHFTLPEAQAR